MDRRRLFNAGRAMFAAMGELNLGLIAAGIAFFGMLGLFPSIAALIAIWGFVADPARIAAQVGLLSGPLPEQVADLITARIAELVAADPTTLGWAGAFSLGISLWSAHAAVAALMGAMNVIYREDHRSTLARMLTALGLTLALIALAILALVALILVPIAVSFLSLGAITALIVEVLRWLVAGTAVVLALGLIYRYGPNRRPARIGWISPGAMLATLVWAAATVAFAAYLRIFADYNELYGSIGAVVVLLLWLYLTSYVCLLGASLNAEIELQEKRDTTTGPTRPPGRRGAYVADTVPEVE